MNPFKRISPENRTDLAALWRLMAGYKGRIVLAAATMFLTILVQFPLPFLTMMVVDRLIKNQSLNLIPLIAVGMLAFGIFSSVVAVANTLVHALLREHVMGKLQLDVLDRLQRTPIRFFCSQQSGYLSTRIRSDLRNIQSLLAGPLLSMLQNVLLFAGGLISMYFLHRKLMLVTLGVLPIFTFSIIFFNKRIRSISLIIQELNAQFGSRLQESLAAIPLIKSFCLETENYQRLHRKQAELIQRTLQQEVVGSVARRFTAVLGMIVPLAILWFGASEFLAGRITIGKLVAFQALLGFVFNPTQALMNQNIQIQSALVSLKRLMELIRLPHETERKSSHRFLDREDIDAESITFSYQQAHPVLSGLDLSINAGEKVMLAGPSGEGKTTLLRLLIRLYDLDAGAIYLGGVNIRELSVSELRSKISVVFQEPFLLSGTVEENLRYGNRQATVEQLWEAAKLAEAHDFILKLENGYKTVLGEAGVTLSAGQKMRLAIARAILKDAPIVLLDEPTSALDEQTEQLVIDNLRRYLQGRTVLIISHHPSLVQLADRVCILKGGRIIEELPPQAFLSSLFLHEYAV